jgi:hypothetical protein
MSTVAELFSRLSGDAWRISHRFSDDILQANALLHNTAATEEEMAECLVLWCKSLQPCQFGRVAANQGRVHFCFLREEAVSGWSDDEIAEKIDEEKRLWKQRAAFDPQRAAHSLVIVISAPQVAFSAPDQHLRAFSDRLLELSGWEPNRRGVRRTNTITSDQLYLRNPADGSYYGFQFNADFFACAGDGRWWHDHRFPGGIAFTANSTGHMMRFREWYDGKNQSEAWSLKQAMLTIKNAAPTKSTDSSEPQDEGKATWLRQLDETGRPLVENVSCPMSNVPTSLEGKDWTRYEGLLHTDHAVREEFFNDRDIAPTRKRPYLMDFTYLFDEKQPDFKDFSRGKLISEADVYSEIGHPEEWTHRAGPKVILPRSEDQAAIVAQQLLACRSWKALPWYESTDGI